MMRVRLKADGRLVEILADGSERALPPVPPEADRRIEAPSIAPGRPPQVDAGYARRVRSQTRLTQAEFAARIGVPIETVRNWEQGKRRRAARRGRCSSCSIRRRTWRSRCWGGNRRNEDDLSGCIWQM